MPPLTWQPVRVHNSWSMAANEYHFVTEWRLKGTCEQVYEILSDVHGLARWWSSVYLKVEVQEEGDKDGVGKVVKLHTKGWLPYTLNWSFKTTGANKPNGFSLEAFGDFDGTGVWTFKQIGDTVEIIYDWRISAEKPLLKRLSWLMKPIFAANHRWAMAQGEKGLIGELAK